MSRSWLCARCMRGGGSKGVFFHARDLPRGRAGARRAAVARDRQPRSARPVRRRHGRRHPPMPAGWCWSGRRCATAAMSTILFGAVSIGAQLIDWSGNCGHLSGGGRAVCDRRRAGTGAAMASTRCASAMPAAASASMPSCRCVTARCSRKARSGEDGVPVGGAEIRLELLEPAGDVRGRPQPPAAAAHRGPAGRAGGARHRRIRADAWSVPANPTVFVRAEALGLERSRVGPPNCSASASCWRSSRRSGRRRRCAWG